MRLLLFSATHFEIERFLYFLESKYHKTDAFTFQMKDVLLKVCITGIGSMISTYSILSAINEFQPDFAIQVGVAGTFDRNIPLGSLAFVESEVLGDLGAETQQTFLDVFDLQLMNENDSVFQNKSLRNPIQAPELPIQLQYLSALTVNTVSGKQATIQQRKIQFEVQLESMEGAAFHYSCLKMGVPFLQLRAISNYVEPRNKANWKMEEAIFNLNECMKLNLDSISNFAKSRKIDERLKNEF